MAHTVRTKDFKAHGVELLSPSDSTFDAKARSLFKGDVDELLKLKPFLTLVANNTNKGIVAFTLEWSLSGASGATVEYSQHKYPDALAACFVRGNEIRAGEQRLVLRNIELNTGVWDDEPTDTFFLKQFSAWASEQARIETLGIEIDAVLFDDGSLLGPDTSDIAAHFTAYFDAKQRLYKEIVTALDSGLSLEEATRSLDVLVAQEPNIRDPLSIYVRLAAEDASRWRERLRSDSANLFREALRPGAFRSHRLINY